MPKARKCNSAAKWCYKCQQCLPYSRFYNDKSRPDGLENKCKLCRRASKEQGKRLLSCLKRGQVLFVLLE